MASKSKVNFNSKKQKISSSAKVGAPLTSIQVDPSDNPPAPIEVDGVSDDEHEPDMSRLRSGVWQHFKLYNRVVEKMVDGEIKQVVQHRAKCIHCPPKKGDYAANTLNGTSTLMKHLNGPCTAKQKLKGQQVITGDKSSENKIVVRKFKHEEVMAAIIEMVVIDEMPFSTVDKPGFRNFCSVAVPLFKIPSRRLFVKEFFKMHNARKDALRKELSTHRVSLTTDTWTSVQNMNYMVITAHFIDNDWKMHKRILSFCQVSNHQGVTIGKLIESCLLEWKIDVLAITVDNASSNKSALEWLKSSMDQWENNKSILGGRFLHVRCTAHIVNLIVKHGLKSMNKSIIAIRNAVAYVKSTPARELSFKNAVKAVKISSKGLVILDVPTRWNSTYEMLKTALELRKAFERLSLDDTSYKSFFEEHVVENDEFNENEMEIDITEDVLQVSVFSPTRKKKKLGPPTVFDWEKAAVFVKFLHLFYDITVQVSSSLKPAIHTAYHQITAIENQLNTVYTHPANIESQTRMDLEKVLSEMSLKMKEKYQKYYGKYKDVNELFFVALALNPRFKMKNIAFMLKKKGNSDDEVKARIDGLTLLMKELYDFYKPAQKIDAPQSPNSASSMKSSITVNNNAAMDFIDEWIEVEGCADMDPKHEVDKYLTDPLEKHEGKQEFEILLWWKLHGPKYPTLATIAKDVLAVQVSTVASESAFSTGGRIVDCSRSSLTPKSVEALICLQSWLKGDKICSFLRDEPSIEATEFYEQCESN